MVAAAQTVAEMVVSVVLLVVEALSLLLKTLLLHQAQPFIAALEQAALEQQLLEAQLAVLAAILGSIFPMQRQHQAQTLFLRRAEVVLPETQAVLEALPHQDMEHIHIQAVLVAAFQQPMLVAAAADLRLHLPQTVLLVE